MLLLLLFAAFFALYGNLIVLWRIGRGNLRLAGGALAHIGFAFMLFGILTSSGFNNPLGVVTPEGPRDNFVVERDQAVSIEGYTVRYTGTEQTNAGHTAYVLDITDPRGRSFTAKPVAFQAEDQWFQHPYIQTYAEKDLFVAVAPGAMFDQGEDQTPPNAVTLTRNQSVDLADYTLTFENFELDIDPALIPEGSDIAVAARLALTQKATGESRTLRPIYLIMADRTQQYIQNRIQDWGLTVTFAGMNVNNGQIRLFIEGIQVMPDDWLVVQAYEKPFINLLWYGTFLMLAGFGLAMARRVNDQKIAERRRAP